MSEERLILQYKNEPDPERRKAILERLRHVEDFKLVLELQSLLEAERDLGVKLLGRVIVNRLVRKHDFELFGERPEEGEGDEADDLLFAGPPPLETGGTPAAPRPAGRALDGTAAPRPGAPRPGAPRPASSPAAPPPPGRSAGQGTRPPVTIRRPPGNGPFLEGLAAGFRDPIPALAIAALAAGLALLSHKGASLLAVAAHDNLALQLVGALVGAAALLYALLTLAAFAGLHYHRAGKGEKPAAGDLLDETLAQAQDLAVVALLVYARALVALAPAAFAALLLGAGFGARGFYGGALAAALVAAFRALQGAEAALLLAVRGHIPYEAAERAYENNAENRALFLLGVAPYPLLALAAGIPLLYLLPNELPACLAAGAAAPGLFAALARFHALTYEGRKDAR